MLSMFPWFIPVIIIIILLITVQINYIPYTINKLYITYNKIYSCYSNTQMLKTVCSFPINCTCKTSHYGHMYILNIHAGIIYIYIYISISLFSKFTFINLTKTVDSRTHAFTIITKCRETVEWICATLVTSLQLEMKPSRLKALKEAFQVQWKFLGKYQPKNPKWLPTWWPAVCWTNVAGRMPKTHPRIRRKTPSHMTRCELMCEVHVGTKKPGESNHMTTLPNCYNS